MKAISVILVLGTFMLCSWVVAASDMPSGYEWMKILAILVLVLFAAGGVGRILTKAGKKES